MLLLSILASLLLFPELVLSFTTKAPLTTRVLLRTQTKQSLQLRGAQFDDDGVVIEVVVHSGTATREETNDLVAYDAIYSDDKEDRVSVVLDSPVSKVLDLVFNPFALVLTLYFFILGINKIEGLFSRILSIFGRKPKDEAPSVSLEDLPYQVFECEVCQMQMRPAKGRAEKIFGRERFRCSRCGSKASAYFNIDDMDDPRAVARIDRLKREEEEEDYMSDLDDDDDYVDDDA